MKKHGPQEDFVFDSTRPEISEEIHSKIKEQVSLFGRMLLDNTVEIAAIATAGYSLAERNVPVFVVSAVVGVVEAVRSNSKRNRIDDLNSELALLYKELDTDAETYTDAYFNAEFPVQQNTSQPSEAE